MDSLNYERENQKEHIEIGKVYYQDSEKDQLFIATLELFGNGYDVTVYEGEEPQYTNRCVVRETSYEFVQYTDDGEMLIVRVNDDLFVMIEQQFELVKSYYDLLKSAPNAINTFRPIKDTIGSVNSKSAGQYFEEDDETYYIYEAMLNDPKNIRLRVKVISKLFEEIQYMNRIKTYGDLLQYISLMEESLSYIISVKSSKDKRLHFTKMICLNQLGNLSAYKGEIDNAIKYWNQSIESATKSPARENYSYRNVIGASAVNIMCFLNYLDLSYISDKIQNKYSDNISFFTGNRLYVDEQMNINHPSDYQSEVSQLVKKMLNANNSDIYTVFEFYSDDYDEFFEEGDDVIQDSYNATYFKTLSIKDNLINGVYSTIFEKEDSDTEKQKLRIQEMMAVIDNDIKGQPLNITQTDFSYLVRQLNNKMGLSIIGDAKGSSDFLVFKCRRDNNEEFGIGCLLDNRKVSKNDIKLLWDVADRNFVIFSYFDYGVSSVKGEYGQNIDIISGKDFIEMVNKHLKINIM